MAAETHPLSQWKQIIIDESLEIAKKILKNIIKYTEEYSALREEIENAIQGIDNAEDIMC